jgi:hypothetical protein
MPDWIVDAITLNRDSWYRLHVEGHNLSDAGRSFTWSVKDVADPRYDLTRAKIAPDAVPFLGREVS